MKVAVVENIEGMDISDAFDGKIGALHANGEIATAFDIKRIMKVDKDTYLIFYEQSNETYKA